MIVPEGIVPTKGGGYTSYIFKKSRVGLDDGFTRVIAHTKEEAFLEAKRRLKSARVELVSFKRW